LALTNKKTANPELWIVIHSWLTLLNNKVSRQFCKFEITTHPDYPALTSVTDFLDNGNMEYHAVQTDIAHINQMHYPLLAHIQERGNNYMYPVISAAQWQADYDTVTKNWSGITLYPAAKTKWVNEANADYVKKEEKQKQLQWLLGIICFTFFIASLFVSPSLGAGATAFLSLIGVVISMLALSSELGYQSQAVKQVCGTLNKGGCGKVLKSNYAKGIWGVTPADAAVLYFATQLITYFGGLLYKPLHTAVQLIALAGIIALVWSIYTQAVKLKEWCALCVGIALVLLLQAVIVLVNYTAIVIPITALIIFTGLFLVLTAILVPIKQLIKTNTANAVKLAELKKWKVDIHIFKLLWQQEQQVDITEWPNDLVIGNANAPVVITVACNPYCGPCAKAHIQLDDLLHSYTDKVKVQVRLMCNAGDITDKRTIAVKAILQNALQIQDKTVLQNMLTDWFDMMDYSNWWQKWQCNKMQDVTEQMQKHNEWMKNADIQFTPTFFINGRKLPGRYSIVDLELLLPDLINS
jgi:protein-disulfide isomerase